MCACGLKTGSVSSRLFDLLKSMIQWSRWSVDLRWMFEYRCYIHPLMILLIAEITTQSINLLRDISDRTSYWWIWSGWKSLPFVKEKLVCLCFPNFCCFVLCAVLPTFAKEKSSLDFSVRDKAKSGFTCHHLLQNSKILWNSEIWKVSQ